MYIECSFYIISIYNRKDKIKTFHFITRFITWWWYHQCINNSLSINQDILKKQAESRKTAENAYRNATLQQKTLNDGIFFFNYSLELSQNKKALHNIANYVQSSVSFLLLYLSYHQNTNVHINQLLHPQDNLLPLQLLFHHHQNLMTS